MEKEDFKYDMKQIFDEALEEFSKQPIHIPHSYIGYECPECNQEVLKKIDYPLFECDNCKAKVRLQFITIEKGLDS